MCLLCSGFEYGWCYMTVPYYKGMETTWLHFATAFFSKKRHFCIACLGAEPHLPDRHHGHLLSVKYESIYIEITIMAGLLLQNQMDFLAQRARIQILKRGLTYMAKMYARGLTFFTTASPPNRAAKTPPSESAASNCGPSDEVAKRFTTQLPHGALEV